MRIGTLVVLGVDNERLVEEIVGDCTLESGRRQGSRDGRSTVDFVVIFCEV